MMPGHDISIDVVSLGTDLQVPRTASSALRNAQLVIGAERHLAAVDCGRAATELYPSPISGISQIIARAGTDHIVVLASGDALFFGIGSLLLRNHDPASLRFHSNVTSVQTACARLGRPWQEIQFVSLHGRPLTRLRAVLAAGKTLALFTNPDNTPGVIARELAATGYPDSRIQVCESLDSDDERVREYSAAQLADSTDDFHPLNLVLVDVRGSGGLLPVFPGIADELFGEGGERMFTKREVRLAALSRLALNAGECGWDIGAGSGGIAIEWARWAPRARVFAIERDAGRRKIFDSNRARFGDHGNLELIAGEAPAALAELPEPNAIYLGGNGGHLSELLDICWRRLPAGGRLVAAGVTLETRGELQNHRWTAKVEFSDIAISHAAPLGARTVMRAQLPVLLATAVKS